MHISHEQFSSHVQAGIHSEYLDQAHSKKPVWAHCLRKKSRDKRKRQGKGQKIKISGNKSRGKRRSKVSKSTSAQGIPRRPRLPRNSKCPSAHRNTALARLRSMSVHCSWILSKSHLKLNEFMTEFRFNGWSFYWH